MSAVNKTIVLLPLMMFAVLPVKGEKVRVHALTDRPVEMTFYAIDEKGNPLAGEPVKLWPFREDKLFAKWGELRGVTDANGYFRVRGTPGGKVNCGLFCYFRPNDRGYYESFVEVGTIEQPIDMVVTGVVRKIGNPIKLYGRDVHLYHRKELSAEFGIDIVKGALMPPDGNGSVTDAIFRVSSDLWEDLAEGRKNPRKVYATLEMVDKQGGFVKVPYFRNCIYDLTREAPVEGKYNPVLSGSIDLTSQEGGEMDMAGCEYMKTHSIYKVIRGSKGDASEKHAFYGLVYHAEFGTMFDLRDGYRWRFDFALKANGHPNDRNLEWFASKYLRTDWYEANFDRIEETPTPDALK